MTVEERLRRADDDLGAGRTDLARQRLRGLVGVAVVVPVVCFGVLALALVGLVALAVHGLQVLARLGT